MKACHLLLALPLLAASLHAQTPPSIPGVPEPGLTIWGAVTSSVNGSAVTIASASWTLTDNVALPNTTSFTLTSTPPAGGVAKPYVRIVNQGGASYYVMQVPFDSRTIGAGAGAVTLADPNKQPDEELQYPSFAIKASSPPTYAMMPTINGLPANLKSVDGVNASGTSFTTPGTQNPGFTFAERGRVVRVDLVVTPPADPYDLWAARFFPGHPTDQSGRTTDADRDGQTNEDEYFAGTDPTMATSVLRILTLAREAGGNSVSLTWTSVSGKNYQIETSLTGEDETDAWTPVGPAVPATETTSAQAVPAAPGDLRRLYRVRVRP